MGLLHLKIKFYCYLFFLFIFACSEDIKNRDQDIQYSTGANLKIKSEISGEHEHLKTQNRKIKNDNDNKIDLLKSNNEKHTEADCYPKEFESYEHKILTKAVGWVSVSSDGLQCAFSGGHLLTFWDFKKEKQISSYEIDHKCKTGPSMFTDDGKYFLYSIDNQLYAQNLISKKVTKHPDIINYIIGFDYMNNFVVTSDYTNNVILWDIIHGTSNKLFETSGMALNANLFLYKSKQIVLATGAPTQFHYWDEQTGHLVADLERLGTILDLDMNKMGLVAVLFLNKIKFFKFNVLNKRLKILYEKDIKFESYLRKLKFLSDKKMIVTGEKGQVIIVNVNKGNVEKIISLFKSYPKYGYVDNDLVQAKIVSMDIFSVNGNKKIIFGTNDGAVVLMDLKSEQKQWINRPSNEYILNE